MVRVRGTVVVGGTVVGGTVVDDVVVVVVVVVGSGTVVDVVEMTSSVKSLTGSAQVQPPAIGTLLRLTQMSLEAS